MEYWLNTMGQRKQLADKMGNFTFQSTSTIE